MIKRLRIALPLLLVAAAVVWFLRRDRGPAETGLTASGSVEATDADLGFQVPGRVAAILVQEGDSAREGDELARLSTEDMTATRDLAVAQIAAAAARLDELRRGGRPQEVAQAEAVVRAAQERSDEARREAERGQRLFDGGALSRQMLDQLGSARTLTDAALDQAQQTLALVREGPRAETIRAQEALVEQARASLARADAALSYAVISAPFSGRITLRHRQPGETVGAGTPVLTLLDPNDRWVRIYVREDQIGAIRIGTPARITSDTYPDRSFAGEVVYIGSEAEFTPRNVQTTEERIRLVYPVKVRITSDPDFVLKPGIPADVVLETGTSG
jgi:HlyD family secretion protein